ncbi:hypothetical protein PAF17_19265 [Paracoccus sp. Z330]|uniref:Uncharacterized protein n=1 Tax=Paracoccus onchidii TaxID=3017813 RepID=A0ABT4ZJZ3_9RHOB|nr:hypothetical protein [Paracoccus onchidii]MDB6179607.1 hypothetical protein [Paracoccus onchidii]
MPLIVAQPGAPASECATPVSLLNLSETIIAHFGASLAGDRSGRSLYDLAEAPYDAHRAVALT